MIEFIKEIAREAGCTALAEMKRLDASRIHAKGTDKDMVTEVDRMIEDNLLLSLFVMKCRQLVCSFEGIKLY